MLWPIGSQIVIATTGDASSQNQSEARTIVAKSADNMTLMLDSPLQYDHLAETIGISDSLSVRMAAEVGVLSRNVVFRGFNDDAWHSLYTAPACPFSFIGEFVTKGCFIGRYGPELDSDLFGATIVLSRLMSDVDHESVVGRFSNVEMRHVGQSFRLGRHPIHFEFNGDMQSSYVKECAIHEAFNRAINIQYSRFIAIERNVIYDVRGAAFVLRYSYISTHTHTQKLSSKMNFKLSL